MTSSVHLNYPYGDNVVLRDLVLMTGLQVSYGP